jgi:hypothetical protein
LFRPQPSQGNYINLLISRPLTQAAITAPATPHSGIVLPAKPLTANTLSPSKAPPKPKSQASTAFTNWFYAALKSIPPSSGVNGKLKVFNF